MGIALAFLAGISGLAFVGAIIAVFVGLVMGFTQKDWRVLRYSGIATGVSFLLTILFVAVGMAVDPLEEEPVPMGPALPPPPTSTPKPTATPKPPDLSDCFSAWDGKHREFTKLVEGYLNDPSSLEHLETRYRVYSEPSTGLHYVYMRFTAKNAFGGRVRHLAKGWFHPETCKASLITIE